MENQNNDIFSKLQGILSTKEGQEQLKNISAMFSQPQQQNDQSSAPPPPFTQQAQPQQQSEGGGGLDMGAISSLLQGFLGGGGNNNQSPPDSSFSGDSSSPLNLGGIDINTILKMQQVFQGMNKNDKNTGLLLALKPHFSEKRCKRVDQAISMMRIFSMLPMLKESGIFAGL